MGVEIEYIINYITGYKCVHCGHHLGKMIDNCSDNGFENWSWCPFCGEYIGE